MELTEERSSSRCRSQLLPLPAHVGFVAITTSSTRRGGWLPHVHMGAACRDRRLWRLHLVELETLAKTTRGIRRVLQAQYWSNRYAAVVVLVDTSV